MCTSNISRRVGQTIREKAKRVGEDGRVESTCTNMKTI